ncbi:MAG TPA: DUF2844 domain-containing protein [Steroidobacteraceae bacterium]|jgi:hypothetical protein|nr:DUF2844 domain-containing protein [Steroidobacteraceae bacterium]
MPIRRKVGLKHLSFASAVLAAALAPHLACAALGEPESTAAEDSQQLKGSIKSMERTNYRVHEIQLPSGSVLREFAAVGGTVFAVAWSGPALPNLRQALGRYFDVYVTAAKANLAGHHHLQIQQNDLVMQSSGHMRAFTGRAYLPQSLPTGTSVEELR